MPLDAFILHLEKLTYVLAALLVGFLLANKNTYDGHAIPLFFEIASAEVCLIIQRSCF